MKEETMVIQLNIAYFAGAKRKDMYNSFGNILRMTTFGESHGKMIGVVLDGVPAGLEINPSLVQAELNRRRPGQNAYTTPRQEEDRAEWVSGIFRGKSTGAPITLLVPNQDTRPEDYSEMEDIFRPSHADYTYWEKYGIRDHRGSGRASARETLARVAAGAIAGQLLQKISSVEVLAWVQSIGSIQIQSGNDSYTLDEIEASPVRCPEQESSGLMCTYLESLKAQGDSTGGVIRCLAKGVPAGWGEPVYLKLSAALAQAMFSLPAVKGFELGSGFSGTQMTGSRHNDSFFQDATGKTRTRTNYSGGIQGGISNGEVIDFQVGFKPVSTIAQSQQTLDKSGKEVQLEAKGRHDPCVVPRAVPLVEAMTRLVLADFALLNLSRKIIDS
jgi:chorismate synthase